VVCSRWKCRWSSTRTESVNIWNRMKI
jgi:hypothetical protein